jgi:hypothetical protein
MANCVDSTPAPWALLKFGEVRLIIFELRVLYPQATLLIEPSVASRGFARNLPSALGFPGWMAPKQQTAVVIEATGGLEQLKLTNSFNVPSRKPGHVLVRLHSTSVNPVDTQLRAGYFQPKEFPKVGHPLMTKPLAGSKRRQSMLD